MTRQESFSKGRSPRYPRISLESAISYARRLYEEGHRSEVDADTAARLMGFSGRSGASAIVIGALRQFGLVDGLRGTMRISDLGMKVLQPVSADEEEDARHEAAFTPEVYDKAVAHFEGELPRSDEPIKAYLIRTLGFSRAGAEECISTLRKTLVELETYKSDLPKQPGVPTGPRAEVAETRSLDPEVKPYAAAGEEFVRIPLTRDCVAELRLIGEVTEGAVDKLIQYIELMKDVWAES